jgi:hypothetical protein
MKCQKEINLSVGLCLLSLATNAWDLRRAGLRARSVNLLLRFFEAQSFKFPHQPA